MTSKIYLFSSYKFSARYHPSVWEKNIFKVSWYSKIKLKSPQKISRALTTFVEYGVMAHILWWLSQWKLLNCVIQWFSVLKNSDVLKTSVYNLLTRSQNILHTHQSTKQWKHNPSDCSQTTSQTLSGHYLRSPLNCCKKKGCLGRARNHFPCSLGKCNWIFPRFSVKINRIGLQLSTFNCFGLASNIWN